MDIALGAEAARQGCALAHQIWRDAKRAARRDHDPTHGVAIGVVISFHHTATIAQDCVFSFGYAIWRQATFAFTQAHAAPCAMKPDADAFCGLKLIIQARIVGPQIMMITAGGAAAE